MKKILLIIGVIVVLVVSYSIGRSGASTEINGQKVKYDALVKKTTDTKKNLNAVQDKSNKLEDQFKGRKAQFDHAAELASKIDSLQSDIDKKTGELNGLTDKINTANSDIQSKQAELDKLTAGVKAKQDAPRQFSAGQYTVGKDFPAGRYKAVPVGEGSNFFIHDGDTGMSTVNTILGSASQGYEPEYVFNCKDGDIMETHSSVKLIAVE
ncbi:hypothetical protein [Bacillus sp. EB600]|uniref:coiled-coil domain-containing protein n=1 Tax=Bacillus sp. EB600 TaxID=2806345 RepID=UPI00210D3852|nr:hypothetical protein [Bacillus sp. EB600]MCQ6280854.1 hypothetical protein [Bacillus sp. EB600]